MKGLIAAFLTACLALAAPAAQSQSLPKVENLPLNARWDEGAADCKTHRAPPLEVRAYDGSTYVIRETLCATFEAPFMYLLIGKARALLIDTGDVADPAKAPLAKTVFALLPSRGGDRLPLLVVHTHRHSDHRAADAQFAGQPNVQVVGYDLDSVKRYYGFSRWPEGQAQIDLGGRIVDVVPTPGHNATHLMFYDRGTRLLFSGDFLLPGRLLIDDAAAERASARRAAAFIEDRPVAAVLGGHIELDAAGKPFEWESTAHPGEHVLPLTKADMLALPAAADRFNGFFTRSGGFVMIDSLRILGAMALAALLVLVAAGWGLIAWLHRRRARARGAG